MSEGYKMIENNPTKVDGKITGILFIVAIITGMLGVLILPYSEYSALNLETLAQNKMNTLLSIFFIILMALACAGIPISMFTILRKQNENIAIMSVIFRTIESLLFLISVIMTYLLLILSQNYFSAGLSNDSYSQALINTFREARYWISGIIANFAFNIGALAYTYLFYSRRLIPRYLGMLGIIAIMLGITNCICILLGFYSDWDTMSLLFHFPTLIYEAFLGVWLIVKGFSVSENVFENQYISKINNHNSIKSI